MSAHICPYCGRELEDQGDGTGYWCPNCRDKFRPGLDGLLHSVWDFINKSDVDVDPEEWQDYEDGKKTSW